MTPRRPLHVRFVPLADLGLLRFAQKKTDAANDRVGFDDQLLGQSREGSD
jgi:hypothetical protein